MRLYEPFQRRVANNRYAHPLAWMGGITLGSLMLIYSTPDPNKVETVKEERTTVQVSGATEESYGLTINGILIPMTTGMEHKPLYLEDFKNGLTTYRVHYTKGTREPFKHITLDFGSSKEIVDISTLAPKESREIEFSQLELKTITFTDGRDTRIFQFRRKQ